MAPGRERIDFIYGAVAALTSEEGGRLGCRVLEQLMPSVDRTRLGIDIAEEWGSETRVPPGVG